MYKIFMVEDDPVIAQTVSAHLTMWGYQVQVVSDFTKTIQEFTAFSPHLVLLDIGLPGMNGYHWCRELRRRSKVPVVFLSSAADNLNIVTAWAGMILCQSPSTYRYLPPKYRHCSAEPILYKAR